MKNPLYNWRLKVDLSFTKSESTNDKKTCNGKVTPLPKKYGNWIWFFFIQYIFIFLLRSVLFTARQVAHPVSD